MKKTTFSKDHRNSFCVHSSRLTTLRSSYSFSRRGGKSFVLYDIRTTQGRRSRRSTPCWDYPGLSLVTLHFSYSFSKYLLNIWVIREWGVSWVKYHKIIFVQESMTYQIAPYTKLSSSGTPLPRRHLVVLKTDSVPKTDTYSCYTNNGRTWRGQRLGSSCSLGRKMWTGNAYNILILVNYRCIGSMLCIYWGII